MNPKHSIPVACVPGVLVDGDGLRVIVEVEGQQEAAVLVGYHVATFEWDCGFCRFVGREKAIGQSFGPADMMLDLGNPHTRDRVLRALAAEVDARSDMQPPARGERGAVVVRVSSLRALGSTTEREVPVPREPITLGAPAAFTWWAPSAHLQTARGLMIWGSVRGGPGGQHGWSCLPALADVDPSDPIAALAAVCRGPR